MKDNLVECKKCGGNACYEQHISESVTTWLCMGCGFTTSTLMVEGSKPLKDLYETTPELYKDLIPEDTDGRFWCPSTITLPGKGMVFLDGSAKDKWNWSAVKVKDLTKEEIDSKKFPEGQTFKMDMNNAQSFKPNDFMDALEVIGFYNG